MKRNSRSSVAAEKARAVVLPATVAATIFALIIYLQFSTLLGQYNFIIQFPLGMGFYYCWAWHVRLAQRATAHEVQQNKS